MKTEQSRIQHLPHPSRLDVDESGEIQIEGQPFGLADISMANELLFHFKGDWQAAIDCVRVTAELRHIFNNLNSTDAE